MKNKPRDPFSDVAILRKRIQIALEIHGSSIKEISVKTGKTEGHLALVLYYGRKGGAPAAFAAVAHAIGFDPRYGISSEVRNYLNKLANPVPPPRKDAADTPAQGSA